MGTIARDRDLDSSSSRGIEARINAVRAIAAWANAVRAIVFRLQQALPVATILAVLASSGWLLSVDIAGRVMIERWRTGDLVDPAHWLTRLALVDPRIGLKAGEQCIQSAADAQSCRGMIEQALRDNARLSSAEVALIVLAEQRGDVAAAGAALHRLRQRDRSFSVRWLEWNFWFRNGAFEQFKGAAIDIARVAPPAFRGDFAFLLLAGADNRKIAEAMLRAGRGGRALDYALFLAERGRPEADELLLSLMDDVDRDLSRAAVLRFVAGRLRERRGADSAAAVWAKSVKIGLVPDRRAAAADDPVLNSNPRLRMPFVPRSFDWSVAADRRVSVSQAAGGGARIEVGYGVPAGTALLSKALVTPELPAVLRVTMHVKEAPEARARGNTFESRAVWQIYDTRSEQIVMRSSPGGRACGSACREFELLLEARGSPHPVYALLSTEDDAASSTGPEIVTITDISFAFDPPPSSR